MSSERPATTSKRSANAITWLLRIAVALQCVGYAWQVGVLHVSPLFSWLWGQPDTGGLGLSEIAAMRVEQALAAGLALAAVSALVRPSRLLLWFATLFTATFAYASWRTSSGFQADLSWLALGPVRSALESIANLLPFATAAARIVLPLVLLLVYWSPARKLLGVAVTPAAEWMARVAIAFTFASHGLEALQHYGPFVDMLIVAADRLLDWRIEESLAKQVLTTIGVIDVIVAVLIVTRRWRAVAWYMAAWGGITALARVVVYGTASGWHPCVIRSAHWVLPLVLALAWRLARPEPNVLQSKEE